MTIIFSIKTNVVGDKNIGKQASRWCIDLL